VEGLQEVARGNYSVKVSIQSSSEMNRAGEAFNEMTEKLEKNNLIEKIWNENWKE
jgi:nitrogen fixation/metabolism regulation signal transduction histidine kinase